MKRTFIESPLFSKLVKDGIITEEHLWKLQLDIMKGRGETIAATAGLMKIRCAGRGRGKRGGLRVILADYPHAETTFLLAAFPKSVKESLTAAETAELKRMKLRLDRIMGR